MESGGAKYGHSMNKAEWTTPVIKVPVLDVLDEYCEALEELQGEALVHDGTAGVRQTWLE